MALCHERVAVAATARLTTPRVVQYRARARRSRRSAQLRNWAQCAARLGALKRRPEPREVTDVNIERRSSPLAVNTVPTEANLNRN